MTSEVADLTHYGLLFLNEDGRICLQTTMEGKIETLVKFASVEHVQSIVEELLSLVPGSNGELLFRDYTVRIQRIDTNTAMLKVTDNKCLWIRALLRIDQFVAIAEKLLSPMENVN